MEERGELFFLLLEAFSFAAFILKYSLTTSTGVSDSCHSRCTGINNIYILGFLLS